MAEYRGVIELRICNEGTKSHGQYAMLNCDDGLCYTLYREGLCEVNDPYFVDFANQQCAVEGQCENDVWICVESIMIETEQDVEVRQDAEAEQEQLEGLGTELN